MAQNSKIEWCHHTANLWHGCTKVHEGCDNCYAEALAKRWGNDIWGNDKPRKEIVSVFRDLAKYQKLAKDAGEMHRVFVGSMMDIFEKPMPLINSKGEKAIDWSDGSAVCTDQLRDRFFENIDNECYPNLLFLLLTKRPSNINKYVPESWKTSPPENVMFGTSPVNQETANKLIPQLLQVNGKKFLSVEPQLGPVSFNIPLRHFHMLLNDSFELDRWQNEREFNWTNYNVLTGSMNDVSRGNYGAAAGNPIIDWVIQGGESGHKKRAFDLNWARAMRDESTRAGIPYFFKQIDKVQPIPDEIMIREFPKIKTAAA